MAAGLRLVLSHHLYTTTTGQFLLSGSLITSDHVLITATMLIRSSQAANFESLVLDIQTERTCSQLASRSLGTLASISLAYPGDCPVCLYPLQGRNITKRPCEHMLCTPCYLDGVRLGGKDSPFNRDACEQCRDTPYTKTRHGSSLLHHFQASKQRVASTSKRKGDEPRGRPPREGPSLGSERAGAGADKRVEDPERPRKKKKIQEEKADEEDGGFTFANRGDVRRLGIAVPAGDAHTCLPDATWPPIKHVLKHQAYFGDSQAIYL